MQNAGTATEENGEQFTVLPADGRQEFLRGISDDASFLAAAMKPLGKLCKTADAAAKARDEYFSTKMNNPAFAERVQRVRDWGSNKQNNDVLVIDGKEYRSVKKFFKEELGVTYEYVLRFTAKAMRRLNFLLQDDDQPQANACLPPANPPQARTAPPAAPRQPAAQELEILAAHGMDVSFSVAELVQSAFGFAVSCTKQLSATEKVEFYSKLADRLLDESDELQEKI
jgi:hypothetical protein